MKTIKNMFAKLVRDEQGGEVLEYALIAGLIVVAGHLGWQIASLKINDPAICLAVFKSNRDLGALLFVAILLGNFF